MKAEIYDLADEEFAFFVNRVGEELEQREMKGIFVGGTAVQAHVLNELCKRDNCTIEDLILRDDIRLQDYIRATDDVDVAWKMPKHAKSNEEIASEILGVLDSLSGEYISPSENHLIKYSMIRRGIQRPKFRIEVDKKSNEEDVIAMNIGRKKKDLANLDSRFYDKFIEKGQKLKIPYCENFNINMRVIKPEHLLSAKVASLRAKDYMDIENLIQVLKEGERKINHEEVAEILGPEYEYNFSKYIRLVNGK